MVLFSLQSPNAVEQEQGKNQQNLCHPDPAFRVRHHPAISHCASGVPLMWPIRQLKSHRPCRLAALSAAMGQTPYPLRSFDADVYLTTICVKGAT